MLEMFMNVLGRRTMYARRSIRSEPYDETDDETVKEVGFVKIQEQLVIITGASRGLGKAIAEAFYREGAYVVINYLKNEEAAMALQHALGARAIALRGDVFKESDMEALVAQAEKTFDRPVTTMVANAIDYMFSPEKRKTADILSWPDIKRQLNYSVKHVHNLTRACLPSMQKNSFGRIIVIGSNLLHHPVVPYHDYIVGKGALLGWMRSISRDLGQDNITVNMVSPGLIQITDASKHTPDSVFTMLASEASLGRTVSPEEVADAVLFFASPWSRAITGQELIVDAGLVVH